VTAPVVLAHEEGEDEIGVPLRHCLHCSCPLVSQETCPWHTPSTRPAPLPRRRASSLALEILHHRGSLTPRALASILGCSPPAAGALLWRLAFARKPARAVRVARAVYLPAPGAP